MHWETAHEIDNLGFNLYRADNLTAPTIKLNEQLIPVAVPPGSPFGAVYDWIDTDKVRKNRTYYYWLEDLDIYGVTTLHGPVMVTAKW